MCVYTALCFVFIISGVLVFAFEHQRVGARKMSPVVASWKSQLHATSHNNAQRHLTTLIRNNTLQV